MKLFKNTGFTLIEISVVLIILGLLAVLSLPTLFAQIERHRGQEALHNLNVIKSLVESCGLQNGYNFANCTTWDAIGMDDPSGTHFKYAEDAGTPAPIRGSASFAQDKYSIQAVRVGSASDTIAIDRDLAGAVCNGDGIFEGFC